MAGETEIPVEERLLQLLQHLGIKRAHFAMGVAGDWQRLATTHPETIASSTLVYGIFKPDTLSTLASPVLVITGDQAPWAERAQQAVASLPKATLVTIDSSSADYRDIGRGEEVGSTMTEFLARMDREQGVEAVHLPEGEGEVAGISYRIRGSGPPLVLLPLGWMTKQWEPLD